MNAILDTIVAGLRSSLPGQEARVPIPQLQTSPHYDVPCLSLVDYLTRPDKNGIIAEFKRASPSRGAYRLDADLSETTRGYMQSGCSGLSILTEPDHFQGSLEDLRLARRLHWMAQAKIAISSKRLVIYGDAKASVRKSTRK